MMTVATKLMELLIFSFGQIKNHKFPILSESELTPLVIMIDLVRMILINSW